MLPRARVFPAVALAVAVLLTAPTALAAEPEPAVPTPTESAPTETTPTQTTPTEQPTDGPVGPIPPPDVPNPSAPHGGTRLLVIGDSISAKWRYNASGTGARTKAWWARVAERNRISADRVMLSAESGSGLLAKGGGPAGQCVGGTFGDRLSDVTAAKPDVVVVEVGRNDVNICRRDRKHLSTAAERSAAARAYFSRLARIADDQDLARRNIYVMSAWGSSSSGGRIAVINLYEPLARRFGFSWIPLPALPRSATVDSIHPNAAGTRLLADWALAGSDLSTAIRSRGNRHASVPSGVAIRCVGEARCRRISAADPDYSRATRPIWGAKVSSQRHYVAHRLTTHGRHSNPILHAADAAGWRTAALRDRAATWESQPRRGDIAWWPTNPPGTGASSEPGHVAFVERVSKDNAVIVVSELDRRGRYRSVRYQGAATPRAFLRFARATGSPRGIVTSLSVDRRSINVAGRAVDTDAPWVGTRIRVTVAQSGRTLRRTSPVRTTFAFSRTFELPRLGTGRAVITVWALDAPGSRGHQTKIGTRTVTIG